MSPNPPKFDKPFHLAKWVASQLWRHQGASARALYQEYLPAFAEFSMDAGPASALIHQHLKKLEEDGLVISEKLKGKGGPMHWTWVGPIPEVDAAEAAAATVKESLPVDPASGPTILLAPTKCLTTDFAGLAHDAPADPPGMPEITPEDAIASLKNCGIEIIGEQLPITGLEPADEWDTIAASFAQACREQAVRGLRINDLGTKLGVLERLSPIVSDDIGLILDAIGADLRTLGGLTA
jgi:hypothetical protein